MCAWHIVQDGVRAGDSDSSDDEIRWAVRRLNGQAMTTVRIEPDGRRTAFTFDLGGELITEADDEPDQEPSEQWLLFTPGDMVATVRADGRFAYHPGDTKPEDAVWLPITPSYDPDSA